MVLSQLTWPQVKDIDDCWVLSALQCVNVVAPWEHLYGVTAFRAAAGDPDDGNMDGGSLAEIVKGTVGLFPSFAGLLTTLRNVSWAAFTAEANRHRPLSVAVDSGKLPSRLAYGFHGKHQVTIAVKGDGTILFANPLATYYSRWTTVQWADVKTAILGYSTAGGAYAVAYPTDAQMGPLLPAVAARIDELVTARYGVMLESARAETKVATKAAAVTAIQAL